jgi:hypothetical protein
LLSFGSIAAIPFVYGQFPPTQGFEAFSLTVLLTMSLISVMGALTLLVVVLSAFGLTNPRTALGLPDGSIRAVIAISLILLFVVVSVSIYDSLRRIGVGIPPAPAVGFPGQPAVPAALTASEDLAKQVVTTVATLVVAVAGFYFGSQSVLAAQRAVSTPTLRVIEPVGPLVLSLKPGTISSVIRLEISPAGESLTWEIAGDRTGTLAQVRPGEFKYTRGDAAGNLVLLKFALMRYPNITAEVRVVPPQSDETVAAASAEYTLDESEKAPASASPAPAQRQTVPAAPRTREIGKKEEV